MRSSRRGEIAIEYIVGMILLLAFLFIALLVFLNLQGSNLESATVSCWFSMGFRQGFLDLVKDIFANTCRLQAIESLADEQAISSALYKTWFMRGRGDWDEKSSDTIFVAFSFSPSKDIPILGLIDYLKNNNQGVPVKDIRYSDYAYIQKGSKGQTLCFQEKIFNEGKVLRKGANYFVIFYDDEDAADTGDKLMISTTPNKEGLFPVNCDSPDTKQRITIPELGGKPKLGAGEL